jgi:hypothetical protein
MSCRIEHTANALALLEELPGEWAQTCITSPPHTKTSSEVLLVLAEVKRVLRADGTLWLLTRDHRLREGVVHLGFIAQHAPHWATTTRCLRPLLFTKQPCFFRNEFALPRLLSVYRRPGSHRGYIRLIRSCLLASSASRACGACGAPYARCQTGGRIAARRPTCAHNNPTGRCLVLDPFSHPRTPTAGIAHRYGRSFLGITEPR